MDIYLIYPKFRIQLLDRADKLVTITYHASVRKDLDFITGMKSHMGGIYDICQSFDFPIFFKSKNSYQLVARYWLLNHIIDEKIDIFPAIVFDDESLIPQVLACEEFYSSLYNKDIPPLTPEIVTPVPAPKLPEPDVLDILIEPASDATKSRQKSKKGQRMCPRPGCKGTLAKSIGKNKVLKYIGKANQVTCGYKRNKGYFCPFHALLTPYEFERFKKNDLKTSDWLFLLANEVCGKCGGPVFRRILHDDATHTKTIDHCAKHYLEEQPSCTWHRTLKS